MSFELKVGPENVINQLMEHKNPLELKRTGFFQSRTVTVGNATCSLQQLITDIGQRINEADVTKDDDSLKNLRQMLITVSAAEKDDRILTSSLFHFFFSSRDKDVKQLEKAVNDKIYQHDALSLVKDGLGVEMKFVSAKVRNILSKLYGDGTQIKGSLRITNPIHINQDSKSIDWDSKSSNGVEVQFYMDVEGMLEDSPMYRMKLVNEDEINTRAALVFFFQAFPKENEDRQEI
jgi:hypothetical protein